MSVKLDSLKAFFVESVKFCKQTISQGLSSPQGPPGATGATGPQGIQGIQGPIGPNGTTRSAGPQSPSGITQLIMASILLVTNSSEGTTFAEVKALCQPGDLS